MNENYTPQGLQYCPKCQGLMVMSVIKVLVHAKYQDWLNCQKSH